MVKIRTAAIEDVEDIVAIHCSIQMGKSVSSNTNPSTYPIEYTYSKTTNLGYSIIKRLRESLM